MNEKVSIIIPVYNAEKCIVRCLDSIRSQTYENVEVLVINDFSTDASFEMLPEYQKHTRK